MATGWGRQVRLDQTRIGVQVAPTKTYTTPFASLSTANPNDDGQSNAEPTAANGYVAQAITWNTPTQPSNDAACNATNSAAINFGPSTAAWSTGATALGFVGIWNSSTTRTEAAFLARTTVAGGGFAVNAAGITITLPANTGIVLGLISA